ncbi:periplasmic binding protein/LacI transcriptional regulator [Rubrobacter xylanophilus DSM 9941]|uniref:Periplasmic binding protein/LacI transcriptional regulator n=1 Tax=Rubrobacter xylanophilus (strain DSM 9941 / JCM 11954 / NBRC 16129 / PRD-1) TaxID=266117 RepID=Q1AXG3_RUBXD|nr:D-ribose ABC transporter substrate-binding protein [Rubrobacter xylanophilus]ABG03915.1 periplasmic binding protein/LacI transcriptional regulator [Rubrobacter xylanophilus DSM 9941]
MRRAALCVLLVVLAAALVAGCGRGGGGGEEGQRTIGLSISTLNNPFFVTLRDGAQRAAKEAGVELIVSDAQNDAAQQQDDIQAFITQQVDAILVNPVDSEAVVPAIQAANDAGIPVIALDRGAAGGEIETLIASDNVEGGRMAARELIRLVGSGPVAQLEGIPGTSAARDRGKGFEEVIEGQDAVRLVASQPANFDRAQGLNVTQNILQAHPEIKGIFAQNDEMALGAVRALGERAGTEVKIVGFDAIEDALKAIRDGRMNATIAQQPAKMGSLGVRNAIKVIEGESVPKNIPVEVRLVTKENVSEFLGQQ